MADLSEQEFTAAAAKGQAMRANAPFATAAHFDARSGRLIVDLTNGATFAFPPQLVQGLADASPAELAQVELMGDGYALGWDGLDVHLTVPGLLSGVFGTAKWMAHLAGKTPSAAKAAAARANGRKGGRPRKAA